MAAHVKKKVVKKKQKAKPKRNRALEKSKKALAKAENDYRELVFRDQNLGRISGDSLKFRVNGQELTESDVMPKLRAFSTWTVKESAWRRVLNFILCRKPKTETHDMTEKAVWLSQPEEVEYVRIGEKVFTVSRRKWQQWFSAQDAYNTAQRLAEQLKDVRDEAEKEMFATQKGIQ